MAKKLVEVLFFVSCDFFQNCCFLTSAVVAAAGVAAAAGGGGVALRRRLSKLTLASKAFNLLKRVSS